LPVRDPFRILGAQTEIAQLLYLAEGGNYLAFIVAQRFSGQLAAMTVAAS